MAQRLTTAERRWCLVYSVLIAGLTTLPYVVAFFQQTESWRFSGFLFAVEDGNSYIAKMRLGSEGDWLFRTPYTSRPQTGVLAFMPYLLLGKAASGTASHDQLVVLYHLFRVLALPLWVLAIYSFASVFIEEVQWRRWVTVLSTLGGGLGWLLVLLGGANWLGSLPLEFYSPESFGFLAAFGIPHLVLARALLLLGFVAYMESERSERNAWLAGFVFLGLGLVQPLSVVTAYAVIVSHLALVGLVAWRERRIERLSRRLPAAVRSTMVSFPLVVYLLLAFRSDEFLSQWTAQNRILSPHPFHYFIAYGLVAAPALAGGIYLLRNRINAGSIPVAWALVFPLLAYAPTNLQRRLPEGVWVILATLAAVGIWGWTQGGGRGRLRWIPPVLLLLAFPGALLLMAGAVGVAMAPGPPAFRPAGEIASFAWLEEAAEPRSVVLSSFETGNPLPAYAPLRVVVGHGPESAGLEALLPQVRAFYANEF